MNVQKIVRRAKQFKGNIVSRFHAEEQFGNFRSISTERECIRWDSNPISTEFSLQEVPKKDCFFRLRFMPDYFRELPCSYLDLAKIAHTVYDVEIQLNGGTLYAGKIFITTHRRWRFWPSIDLAVKPGLLKKEKNQLVLRNLTTGFRMLNPPEGFDDTLLKNTALQLSDVQLLTIPGLSRKRTAPELPEGTHFGHLVAGHSAAYHPEEDLSLLRDAFLMERQGDLLVFLINPWKMSYDFDLDKVDCRKIRESGLKVVIRFYGACGGPNYSPEIFQAKLQNFIDRLGDAFLGFGSHERYFLLTRNLQPKDGADVTRPVARFHKEIDALFAKCRSIAPEKKPWVTDPSWYHRHYLQCGAAFPGLESGIGCLNTDVASVRGSALAFGKDCWAVINSYSCQAYGGLKHSDQQCAKDPTYEWRRIQYWQTSQAMLYLGGARMLYTESGAYENRNGKQHEFDSPYLTKIRACQTELVKFSKDEKLQGQPRASIAFLQGKNDLFPRYTFNLCVRDDCRKYGNAILSWNLLGAVYPDFVPMDPASPAENREEARKRMLHNVMRSPYGEIDILPVEAPDYSRYQVAVMGGWNTLEEAEFQKLMQFAKGGGTLFVTLPQLTSSTDWSKAPAGIRNEFLEPLCGCTLKSGKLHLAGATVAKGDAAAPVLLKHQVGKGTVWLYAFPDFPETLEAWQPAVAALKEILRKQKFPVTVRKGKYASFYLYPQKDGKTALYVLRNDWECRSKAPLPVELQVGDKELSFPLRRGEIKKFIVDLPKKKKTR